jgi:hypothetical protein
MHDSLLKICTFVDLIVVFSCPNQEDDEDIVSRAPDVSSDEYDDEEDDSEMEHVISPPMPVPMALKIATRVARHTAVAVSFKTIQHVTSELSKRGGLIE